MSSNSLLYLVGAIISAIFPYLILAYMARHLPIEQLGYLALLQTVILSVTSVVNLNTSSAIERFHYENMDKSSQYVVISLITATLVSALLLGSSFIFKNQITTFFELNFEHIVLAIILGYFCYIFNVRHMLYQINFQPTLYIFVQILYSFVPFSIFFGLIMIYQDDFFSRILSLSFSYFIFAILSVISILKITSNQVFHIKAETIKKSLKYSYPLIINTMINIANLMVLRFLVNHYTNLKITGTFFAIFQLSMAASFIVNAVNRAFSPYAIKTLTTNDAVHLEKLSQIKKSLLLISIIGVTLAYLVSDLLIETVLGVKFLNNGNALFLLLLGHIFHGLSFLYLPEIFVRNQTQYTTISNFCSFIILIGCMYILSNDLSVLLVAKLFALQKFTFLILIILFSNKSKIFHH